MSYIVNTPEPSYYAVTFTSVNADCDHTGRTDLYGKMVEIADGIEGFIGFELSRNADGAGVATIYWKDLDSIMQFVRDPQHRVAKQKGAEVWYDQYAIGICQVEREYGRAA